MRDQFAPVIEGFHCDGITNPWSFQSESFYEDGGNGGTMLDGTTVQDVLAVKNRFSWALNVLTMSQYNALIAALDSGTEPDTVSATVFDPATDTRYTTTFHINPPAFRFVLDTSGATVAIPDSPLVLEETGEEKTIVDIIASGDGWTLTSDGLLDIHFNGDMPDYTGSHLPPWYSSREIITNVTIRNSVTNIGESAFFNCTNLTSITIPSSVTSIEYYGFGGCINLTNVTIPNSVTSIGNSAFGGCSGLTSVTIPDSVTSIGDSAFNFCTSLTSVTIPSSVTSIEFRVFSNCRSLTIVTIPSSVTSIEGNAFYSCESLTDVYYSGTETQWNAITIGIENAPLLNATIHYNSTGS